MKWKTILGASSEAVPVWAAICTARADGSNPEYPAREKHAILTMVKRPEPEVEHAVEVLLKSKGWGETSVERLKLLDEPFHSDDSFMRTCFQDAVNNGGGIVVYSDPIEDTPPESEHLQ